MYMTSTKYQLDKFLAGLGENPSVDKLAQAIVLIYYYYNRDYDDFDPKELLYRIRDKNEMSRVRWSNGKFDKLVDQTEDTPNAIIDAALMLFSESELWNYGL